MSFNVISTFSGIGGSSQGYKQAGLNVVSSVEFLDYQAANYRANHPDTKLYQADIRTLSPMDILKDAGLKEMELDILDGSPPCSSFSTAGLVADGWGKVKAYGNTKQRTDDLFLEFIRFLAFIRPKVFVAENVSGLVKGDSKGHFNIFLRQFKDCGYNVKAKLMNAANYGVPQARQRIVFIGVRNDLGLEPVYPEPQSRKISLKEAFADIMNSEDDLMEVDISRYAIYDALKKTNVGAKSEKYMSLKKEDQNKPARTLTATSAALNAASICHWDNRKFTIPELKAIGSFPQSWKCVGKNYQEKAEGIGRAVPPKMMEAIARTIKTEILEKINA